VGVTRRSFLAGGLATAAVRAVGQEWSMPLGYNTYSIRSLDWHDDRLVDFAVENKLDAIFLQDTSDPRASDPVHWSELGVRTRDLGLRLETGGSAVLPRSPEEFPQKVEYLRA
jgi:hypothetical protein